MVACGVVAGRASYLDRVPLAMDTPVYHVPLQFEQLMMTRLYDGGLLAQRARRREVCVETLVQQARTPILSGIHGHVFLELRPSADEYATCAAPSADDLQSI